jgi:hypothetical protein
VECGWYNRGADADALHFTLAPSVLVGIQPDDADALGNSDVSREASLAHDNVLFVDIMNHVIGPTGHFEDFYSLGFILSNFLFGSIRGVNLGHISDPPNLRISQGLLHLLGTATIDM